MWVCHVSLKDSVCIPHMTRGTKSLDQNSRNPTSDAPVIQASLLLWGQSLSLSLSLSLTKWKATLLTFSLPYILRSWWKSKSHVFSFKQISFSLLFTTMTNNYCPSQANPTSFLSEHSLFIQELLIFQHFNNFQQYPFAKTIKFNP
jgi:hypothetical protein